MADDNNDRDNDKDSNDGIGFDGRSVGARAAGERREENQVVGFWALLMMQGL